MRVRFAWQNYKLNNNNYKPLGLVSARQLLIAVKADKLRTITTAVKNSPIDLQLTLNFKLS